MANSSQLDGLRPMQLIDLKAQQSRIRPELEAAIMRVLDHGAYIMGPEVGALEEALAEFCGARHCISCASGTDALLIALMAFGVGSGDAVICPSFTFTATPEVIALIGATPVFADVDAATFNLDATSVRSAIATARQRGLKPKAIIAVDLFGLPADYQTLEALAAEHELQVLSDAAQSFGAASGGRKVGTFGHATATSFFPAKPLGCYGDGGAIFTEHDGLAAVMRSIRLHGKGGDKYDIVRVGINGRLDTLQAAVLLEKLKLFPDEIAKRQQIAERYTQRLKAVVAIPQLPDRAQSVWAQYTIRLRADQRDQVAARLKHEGIPTAVYYPRPLHAQLAYRECPVANAGVPISELLAGEVLSLPMHPYLSTGDLDRVSEALHRALD